MTLAPPLPLLLLLVACGTDGARVEVRDPGTPPVREEFSAPARDTSVMVVHEFPENALQRAPRFVMSPQVISEVRGQNLDADVAGANPPLLLRDGRVAIFVDGSLLLLDQVGTGSERIGNVGSGPGEFRDGVVVRGLGDTLLVYDRMNGRISFVVPGLGVVRTRAFAPSALKYFTGLIGQYADDALLVGTQGFAIEAKPGMPTSVFWYSARIPPGSDSIQLVDSVRGPTIVWRADGATAVRYSRLPVTAAWGEDFLVSDGSTWTIERLAATGQVLARYSLPVKPRPVMPSMRDKDTKVRLELMRAGISGNHTDTTRLFELIREAPTAAVLPVIAEVLVGPDDVAWVKDGGYWYADEQWGWTALHRDGRILGRLTGTGKDPVVAFGTNSVLVRSEDDDGFVTFRVHALSIK